MFALLVALAGCGNGESFDAHQVLQAAADSTAALKSVQMDLKFGPGLTVRGLEVVSATGKFRAPSDGDIVVKARSGGGFLEPEIVSAGGKVYFKALQLLAFQQLTATQALEYPDVARLLDKDHGLAPAIVKGRNAKLDAGEQVDGVDCYKVEAIYGSAELNQALAPIHLTDDVHATLWVAKSDHLLHRLRLDGHLFAVDQTTYAEVHLHDHNGPVDIPSPG
jgi:hypothetical protein